MKEERHYLDTLQEIFIQKMMHKIAQGWDLYGDSTLELLSTIIDSRYYTDSQKSWLMSMRRDYIKSFCI